MALSQFMQFDPEKMPKYKVELHIHLDGSVRITTVWELAQKRGIELKAKTLEELYDLCRVKKPYSLTNFLKPFKIFIPVIAGDGDIIERIAYEFCEDAAKQGILYCEVRYSPHLLRTSTGDGASIDAREVVSRVCEGLARGSADFGLTVKSILCCIRGHPEWSDDVLDLCVDFKDQGVVGMDLAGDESLAELEAMSPEDIEVFQRAESLGIHRTVHAGEAGPPENVLIAVNDMLAERVGHGYHMVKDDSIYEDMKARGIHFEACPYSSCLTGSVSPGFTKHPIVRYAEDGVNFSLNQDDTTVIQKSFDEEYGFVKSLGLSEVHIVRAIFNAARSSFLPCDEKQSLLQQLKDIFGIETCSQVQFSE